MLDTVLEIGLTRIIFCIKVSNELIRKRSYEIWQNKGRQEGLDLAHWFRAEAELEAENPQIYPPLASACFVLPRPAISRPPRKWVAQRGTSNPNQDVTKFR